jgi:hypothetical protein
MHQVHVDHYIYCGVPACVRYSWTDNNSGKKWCDCKNYKVFFEIKIMLYFVR